MVLREDADELSTAIATVHPDEEVALFDRASVEEAREERLLIRENARRTRQRQAEEIYGPSTRRVSCQQRGI